MIRASSLSRASVEAICARPYDDELQARSATDLLQVGGWLVEVEPAPVQVEPGVLRAATVADHGSDEIIGEVRFHGPADG